MLNLDEKSYWKRLVTTFKYLAVFAALAFAVGFTMYWLSKLLVEFLKIIVGRPRIKYVLSQPLLYLIGFWLSLVCLSGLLNGFGWYWIGRTFFLIAFVVFFIVLDKYILQNEKVCSWFNKKRIWCD